MQPSPYDAVHIIYSICLLLNWPPKLSGIHCFNRHRFPQYGHSECTTEKKSVLCSHVTALFSVYQEISWTVIIQQSTLGRQTEDCHSWPLPQTPCCTLTGGSFILLKISFSSHKKKCLWNKSHGLLVNYYLSSKLNWNYI